MNHAILKVKLLSGESFAVNLASAQSGHHEPIMRWQEFERDRVNYIIEEVRDARSSEAFSIEDSTPWSGTMLTSTRSLELSNMANKYLWV